MEVEQSFSQFEISLSFQNAPTSDEKRQREEERKRKSNIYFPAWLKVQPKILKKNGKRGETPASPSLPGEVKLKFHQVSYFLQSRRAVLSTSWKMIFHNNSV